MTTPDPLILPADEFAALKRSARILANIVARNHLAMEAARIEMRQNGPHAGMQWVLNSLPDVWDDPETEWDGSESADEWFDRVESFYRAAEKAAAPPGEAGPSADPPEASPASLAASREQTAASWRAEAAEGKLARLRSALLEGGQDAATVRRRALAILGTDGKGGAHDDYGFTGPDR